MLLNEVACDAYAQLEEIQERVSEFSGPLIRTDFHHRSGAWHQSGAWHGSRARRSGRTVGASFRTL